MTDTDIVTREAIAADIEAEIHRLAPTQSADKIMGMEIARRIAAGTWGYPEVEVESTPLTPEPAKEAPADDQRVRPTDSAGAGAGVQRPWCRMCGGDAYVVTDGFKRVFCRGCMLVVGNCRCE